MNSNHFLEQFGMTYGEALELAVMGKLKYIIEFESDHVEELVCSLNYYDDLTQKELMKQTVMMNSLEDRNIELLKQGFSLDLDNVKFNEKDGVISSEVNVSICL